jgi:hypothetical protein
MAMNNLELEPNLASGEWGSVPQLHAAIESMRLAFADALQYNADPDAVHVPLDGLLSKQYAASRREALYNPQKVQSPSLKSSTSAALHAILSGTARGGDTERARGRESERAREREREREREVCVFSQERVVQGSDESNLMPSKIHACMNKAERHNQEPVVPVRTS